MPHVYEITTGNWRGPDGSVYGQGWSGQLGGRNNPIDEDIQRLGPIPEGWFTIGPAYTHPKLGPVTMDLTPDTTNNMFGRDLFRVHGFGADVVHASEGCIIQIRPVRTQIDLDTDRRLCVVKTWAGETLIDPQATA